MAITRQKKETQVDELVDLLSKSKLTTLANYQGLTVKELQGLRRDARSANVAIKVVKNRLVKVAMSKTDNFKDADTTALKAQLLYAISTKDELASAQLLAKFAKSHESLELIGGYNSDGIWLASADVKALADLPSKDQLRGQLVGMLSAPLSGFVNVLAGNVRGVLNVLNARSEALEG